MVLFNDLLSFPFVLLNKNWGEGEALLSKIHVPAQDGLTKGRVCSLHGKKHFAGKMNGLSEHPSCREMGPQSQCVSVGAFTDV